MHFPVITGQLWVTFQISRLQIMEDVNFGLGGRSNWVGILGLESVQDL